MEDWIHFRKRGGPLWGIHHTVSVRERTGCLSQQGRQKGRVKAGTGGRNYMELGGRHAATLIHKVAIVLVKAGQEQ